MSATESLVRVCWSRQHTRTLEVRDPATGAIHMVSATQATVPRSWRRQASQALTDAEMRRRPTERGAPPRRIAAAQEEGDILEAGDSALDARTEEVMPCPP